MCNAKEHADLLRGTVNHFINDKQVPRIVEGGICLRGHLTDRLAGHKLHQK